jgi:hypothetical protein
MLKTLLRDRTDQGLAAYPSSASVPLSSGFESHPWFRSDCCNPRWRRPFFLDDVGTPAAS